MKITPIEIRQKGFEKKLRGYDKDEVNAFLLSLSNEWERVLDENKETRIKLEQAEKEVQKLREVENSLFKTLKTAEDTGANLVDQANKAAELHLKETEMRAEALMSESKSKARAIIEKAELQAKEMIEEMQEALKDLEKNYRTLENQRDNLLGELKILSSDIMERLERTSRLNAPFKVEDHMKRVRDMVRESEQRISDQKLEGSNEAIDKIPGIDPKSEDSIKQLKNFISSKSTPVSADNPASEGEQPAKQVEKKATQEMPKKEPAKAVPTVAAKKEKNGANPRMVKKPVERARPEGTQDETGGSFFDTLE